MTALALSALLVLLASRVQSLPALSVHDQGQTCRYAHLGDCTVL